jgi:hypothetical protein
MRGGLLVGLVFCIGMVWANPAAADQYVQDGSFEAATGDPAQSPYWTQDGSARICTTCGEGAARTGHAMAAFTSWQLADAGSLRQTVSLPDVTGATFTFYVRKELYNDATATFTAKIDGATVFTLNSANEGSYANTWSLVSVPLGNLSAGDHIVRFSYLAAGTNDPMSLPTAIDLDDVALAATPPPPSGPVGVCRGTQATIVAAQTGDVVTGTPNRDVIVGTGGGDTILSLGGDDLICGGGGKDIVQAGGGKDQVFGEDGNDRLFGQAENDLLSGGKGADQLAGSVGADKLLGGTGMDRLSGGVGKDLLNGGGSADHLIGGSGVDKLIGGAGKDSEVQ